MTTQTELAQPSAPEIKSGAAPGGDPVDDIAREIKAQGAAIGDRVAKIERKMQRTEAAARVEAIRARVGEIKHQGFEALKAANDRRLLLARKGRGTAHEDDQLRRINADIDRDMDRENRELRARVAQLERKTARPHGPLPAAGRAPGAPNVRATAVAAARHYLRTGETQYKGRSLREWESLAAPGFKDMSRGTNADGGFLVAPEYDEGPIEKYLRMTVPMRQHATVKSINAYEFRKPIQKSGATAAWGTELAAAAGTTQQYDLISYFAQDLYAQPLVSRDLLEDAMFDVEAEISSQVQEAFEVAESTAWVSGSGSGQPTGFLGYSAGTYVADGSWAHGKVGYIPGGHASLLQSLDPFIAAEYALKGTYRQGAKYFANRGTIQVMRLIKDTTGQYVWQPSSVVTGQPQSFNGYQLVEVEQMPAIGANAFPVALADWKRAYLIVDRVGLSVLRDEVTAYPSIKFNTRKRVGGGIQNWESLKLIKVATS